MNATQAYARLSRLGVPALRTYDAAAALGIAVSAASVTLARLARAGLIRRVRAGLWWVGEALDLNVEDPPIEDVIELVFAGEAAE